MKKFLSILIALFLFTSVSYSYTKEELSFATEILFRKTAYLDQMKLKQETMAELAYLKRVYKLDSFNLQNKKNINKLNDSGKSYGLFPGQTENPGRKDYQYRPDVLVD